LYPIDILDHYRRKELAKEFDPGLLFPQHSVIKKDWLEQNTEYIEKQYSMFGNLSDYKTRDIQKIENITLYYCPVSSCNYNADSLHAVKLHLVRKHIPIGERLRFKYKKQNKRGFKTVNHLKKRL
jgi:hypothetical protein